MSANKPTYEPNRRDALLGAAATTALAAAPAYAQPIATKTAAGVVYEDRSGRGSRQDGDPGLPDIMVSNGR